MLLSIKHSNFLLIQVPGIWFFFSGYAPILANLTSANIITQPNKLQGERWKHIAFTRYKLYVAENPACEKYNSI